MFFTDRGQVYWLKVHEIPQGGRAARGKPVVNCIAIGERRSGSPRWWRSATSPTTSSLMFATRNGTVKKTVLSAYGNVRSNGINAINIDDDDELIDVQLSDGNNDIVLATRAGMSIRFHEGDVREMGRATSGVKGIAARQGRRRHRHGGRPPRGDAAGGEREGLSASAPSSASTGSRSAAARASSPSRRPRRPAGWWP